MILDEASERRRREATLPAGFPPSQDSERGAGVLPGLEESERGAGVLPASEESERGAGVLPARRGMILDEASERRRREATLPAGFPPSQDSGHDAGVLPAPEESECG